MADEQMLTPNSSPQIRIVPATGGTPAKNQNQNNHRNGTLKCGNGVTLQTISSSQLLAQPLANGHSNGCGVEKQAIGSMEPPDGGARAWCVMVAAFLCNSIIFGIINVYGPIYKELFENLSSSGDSEASSKACKIFDNIVLLLAVIQRFLARFFYQKRRVLTVNEAY